MSKEVKKERIALWLYPDDIIELDYLVNMSSHRSRNDFISESITFYGGYLKSETKNLFLPLAIESSLKGVVGVSEDRLARILFKLSVELSMTMNVLASTCDIDEDTLKKLRGKCIQDVKKSVGKIDLSEIANYQNRGK